MVFLRVALDLDKTAFLGFAVEAILYGMYCILFLLAMIVLLGNPHGKAVNIPMTVTTCLLFALCTTHISLNFDNKWKGLFTEKGKVSISDETPELFADDTILSITNFVGEVVLIYRCWLIWNKRWIVIFIPILLSVSALVCVLAALILLALEDPTAPIAPVQILPLASSSYTISLVLNVLVTGLIIWRIWSVARKGRQFRSETTEKLMHALEIIVESGALYMFIQLLFVIFFNLRSVVQNIIVACAVQIYGIAPTLLLVRIRLGSAYSTSYPRHRSIELSTDLNTGSGLGSFRTRSRTRHTVTIQTTQTSRPIRSEDLHESRLYTNTAECDSYTGGGASLRSPLSFESERGKEDGEHDDNGGSGCRDRDRDRGGRIDSGVAFAV